MEAPDDWAPGHSDKDAEIAQSLLDANGFGEWHVIDESCLESPEGDVIEWDGTTPDGVPSPLKHLGVL